MTKDQQSIRTWMQKAGQATPEKPAIPPLEVRKLRARLILEEALETIHEGLGIDVKDSSYSTVFLDDLELIDGRSPNLVALADGIADLQVVTLGTAVACGIDIEPVFEEVMRSNNSKWWTPKDMDSPAFKDDYTFERLTPESLYCVKDAGWKVVKAPSYSPANIAPIIEAQKGNQ